MDKKRELKTLLYIILFFAFFFFLPVDNRVFTSAILAAIDLAGWYAREHVILCLLPAFFIAGVIAVFVSQGSVIRYFGANANKWLAYSVASVSGSILAVCSCTILPLFSSIHKRGAGLGPAVAFLYSGPAINVLAIILTARVLGLELGIARVTGAVLFSIIIGLAMSVIYRKEEIIRKNDQMNIVAPPEKRPAWKTLLHFLVLVMILVFANWGKPEDDVSSGLWYHIWAYKWYITGGLGLLLAFSLHYILGIKKSHVLAAVFFTVIASFLAWKYIENTTMAPLIPVLVGIIALSIVALKDKTDTDNREWVFSTWGFAKQILPLLAVGVLIAGFLLGSQHDGVALAGLIPSHWIEDLVGGNSFMANFFASVVGALMYFATLTEVPILQGLISAGMGKGPALALLLAGPSLSLPNMLVIRGVMGTQKTIVYSLLVIVMATVSGIIYGSVAG